MATVNYSWNLPTVGGSEDTWGAQLNANWTALDTLLGGTNATEFAILDGATVSTSELNILDGATVTTAEINILDGDTSASAVTLADADRVVVNDGGTMKQVAMTDVQSYILPSGAVSAFAMNTAPSGWLECDGAAVSRSTYAALFSAIGTTFGVGDGSTTFNLPDLRGEFVRGWDDGRGIDSGRAFGSAQTDAMQGHHHGFRLAVGITGDPAGANEGIWNLSQGSTANAVLSPTSDGTNGAPRTASETRPRSIALLYCVKI